MYTCPTLMAWLMCALYKTLAEKSAYAIHKPNPT